MYPQFRFCCKLLSMTINTIFFFSVHSIVALSILYYTSKEPVCPRVELIFKIIIIIIANYISRIY